MGKIIRAIFAPHNWRKRLPFLLTALILASVYFAHQGRLYYQSRAKLLELKNIHTAGQWYRYGADHNNAAAQFNLGRLYHRGFTMPQDDVQAMHWLRKAADQNFMLAQNEVGTFYEEGYGIDRDFAEARKWYSLAAAQGSTAAMWHIGNMDFLGHGAAVDKPSALIWYNKAADLNEPLAQLTLAGLYERGDGVPVDLAKAYLYISLFGLSNWDPRLKNSAPETKVRLISAMTPAELLDAETQMQTYRKAQ